MSSVWQGGGAGGDTLPVASSRDAAVQLNYLQVQVADVTHAFGNDFSGLCLEKKILKLINVAMHTVLLVVVIQPVLEGAANPGMHSLYCAVEITAVRGQLQPESCGLAVLVRQAQAPQSLHVFDMDAAVVKTVDRVAGDWVATRRLLPGCCPLWC